VRNHRVWLLAYGIGTTKVTESGVSTLARTPADILSQADFFAGLSPRQLDSISEIGLLQEYAEGCEIYNLGEPAKNVYVLIDGMVRFAIGFGSRKATAGDILRRGEVFGWAALTPGSRQRIATASCLTPCTVLAIDGDVLVELMERDHTLGYRIMKQLNLLITGTLTAFAAG
jgi:CRP/FNR family transcriptional regulator, cyclic AMP receptor protein